MYPEQRQVYWHSGLYLQPQHFQSLDLHNEYLLSRQRQLVAPWSEGIIECEFNAETLINFSLDIIRLRAILPSGIYIEYPGNCLISSRNFRDAWRYREKPLTLWLALRRFDPRQENVTTEPDKAAYRWLNQDDDFKMKDVYHSGPENIVSHIMYNIHLLTEEEKESSVNTEYIPIVKLSYEKDRVILDPKFSPPVISLPGSPSLELLLSGLYAELCYYAIQFSKRELYTIQSSENGTLSSFLKLFAMHSLCGTIPLLKHYFSSPYVHPWCIYGVLIQLIGELSGSEPTSVFSGALKNDTGIELSYRHYDLYACFSDVRNVLLDIIKKISKTINVYVSFVKKDNNIYYADLKPVTSLLSNQIYIELHSEKISYDKIILIDPSEFKVSSSDRIHNLMNRSLAGLPIRFQAQKPSGIPINQDSYYFILEHTATSREDLFNKDEIAFYWASAPEDTTVRLIVTGENHEAT